MTQFKYLSLIVNKQAGALVCSILHIRNGNVPYLVNAAVSMITKTSETNQNNII